PARACANAKSMKDIMLVIARNFCYQPRCLSTNTAMTRKSNDRRKGGSEPIRRRAPSPHSGRAVAFGHPPPKEEGRRREGRPGRRNSDTGDADAPSSAPGPLTQADVPPSGLGGRQRPGSKRQPAGADTNRIARVMARAGLCSRRDAEEWIAAGRVEINGNTVS